MSLLQMSFSGAVFIIAIVIIRAMAINKLPKKTFLVLWELVLLKLLIPFSVPSVLSAYTLISAFSKAETGNAIFSMPQGAFETGPLINYPGSAGYKHTCMDYLPVLLQRLSGVLFAA